MLLYMLLACIAATVSGSALAAGGRRALGTLSSCTHYESTNLSQFVAVSERRRSLTAPPTTFDFDFSGGIAASPGWSTGGFTKNIGKTPSPGTGPSAGVDGAGSFFYAEASGGTEGKLFKLAYDGSVCSAIGQGVSTVAFHYHKSATCELRERSRPA